jgi:hypothetical protein
MFCTALLLDCDLDDAFSQYTYVRELYTVFVTDQVGHDGIWRAMGGGARADRRGRFPYMAPPRSLPHLILMDE